MRKLTVTGKTVEEAVKSGLAELDVPEDRVKVSVIEEPVKGLFGLIGSRDAKVELELVPDALEEAERFLQDVLSNMGLQASIEVREAKDRTIFDIKGSELGIVIGRRGQTLDALQYLVNVVANRYSDEHVRVVLDAENFRKRRRETLENLAIRLAKRVSRTGQEIVLEPMSPLDRKVIHSVLQNHAKVITYSKGQEPNRRVVIDLRS